MSHRTRVKVEQINFALVPADVWEIVARLMQKAHGVKIRQEGNKIIFRDIPAYGGWQGVTLDLETGELDGIYESVEWLKHKLPQFVTAAAMAWGLQQQGFQIEAVQEKSDETEIVLSAWGW